MKSLDEATRIKAAIEGDWMKRPGVTGMDVGYRLVEGKPTDQVAIRVYVDNLATTQNQLDLPSEIEGVPVEIVERRFELH
jgi:hypothetical protein